MRIEDIPDKEFYAEYRRREDIKAKNKKTLEKDMEEHRIFWLKSHGGTDGNDLCNSSYCRIDCHTCDDEPYNYDPNWKNKINNSPSYIKSANKSNVKVSRRDQIIEQANKMFQQSNNKINNSKTNNCPYSSNSNLNQKSNNNSNNNLNNNSNNNYCDDEYDYRDSESFAWCNRDIDPPDYLSGVYEQ